MESDELNSKGGSAAANRVIQESIRRLAGKVGLNDPVYAFGTIKEVNEDERTCSVEITLGELPELIEGVNLMASDAADGFVRIPALTSQVQIKLAPDNEFYVSMWSEISAIEIYIDAQNKLRFDKDGYIWNDGLNGGLINIVQWVLKQNQLVLQLQTELAAISAGIASAGGSYAPGILNTFVKSDFEDTKIKH